MTVEERGVLIDEEMKRFSDLIQKIEFQDYRFVVRRSSSRIYLRGEYWEPDVYTERYAHQTTRKWLLSPFMTDSEVVQTVFKCCLTSMEHRTRESFKYKGARVFGPHFDVEDLVKLCKDRENAGGRQ